MAYDDEGVLLDASPYPALYEYGMQEQHRFEHPERMRATFQIAREGLERATQRMLEQAENRREAKQRFKVGDYVMIDLSHYKFAADALGPAKKLRIL